MALKTVVKPFTSSTKMNLNEIKTDSAINCITVISCILQTCLEVHQCATKADLPSTVFSLLNDTVQTSCTPAMQQTSAYWTY